MTTQDVADKDIGVVILDEFYVGHNHFTPCLRLSLGTCKMDVGHLTYESEVAQKTLDILDSNFTNGLFEIV